MLNFKDSFFAKLFDAIDNNSILIAIDENNKYLPVWCSREYAEMMEGSIESGRMIIRRDEFSSGRNECSPDKAGGAG